MDPMDSSYDFARSILCPRTKPFSLKEKFAREAAISFTVFAQLENSGVHAVSGKKERTKNYAHFITGITSLRTHIKCSFLIRKSEVNVFLTIVL